MRGHLALAFNNAQEISSNGNSKVFNVTLVDGKGQSFTREIMLMRDRIGRWIIISW